MVVRGQGEEEMERLLINGHEVSVKQDKFLRSVVKHCTLVKNTVLYT